MKRIINSFLNSLFGGGTIFWLLIVGIFFGCSNLLGRCDSSDQTSERFTDHEYELMEEIYYSAYEEAQNNYWKLANMYDDLYTTYQDDPGRTCSLDGFLRYEDLEGALPDDFQWFLEDLYD